jgi:heptosyltransferase III
LPVVKHFRRIHVLNNIMHILLSRTDSIGDMVLTLPMAGILKEVLPESRITMLASRYTAPVVRCCEFVDTVLVRQELEHVPDAAQCEIVRALQCDACVHVFPDRDVARLLHKAGIPQRIGTTNRLYHWWTCNSLVRVSRKNSALHEAELNTMLLKPLLSSIPKMGGFVHADAMPRYYGFTRLPQLPEQFASVVLQPRMFTVLLHPKSQGSAPEWSEQRWCELLRELEPLQAGGAKLRIVLTGTEREGTQVQRFRADAAAQGATDLMGQTTLDELIALMAEADGLIASSTGPLHIAAALGKYTLGLFAPRRPMHAGRWKPLGTKAEVLSLEAECRKCAVSGECACINALSAARVAGVVRSWLQKESLA